jgi:hypothetical protein
LTALGETSTFSDADTADLFTGLSRGVDQQLRFVESNIGLK